MHEGFCAASSELDVAGAAIVLAGIQGAQAGGVHEFDEFLDFAIDLDFGIVVEEEFGLGMFGFFSFGHG